jgi:hypothetical protein
MRWFDTKTHQIKPHVQRQIDLRKHNRGAGRVSFLDQHPELHEEIRKRVEEVKTRIDLDVCVVTSVMKAVILSLLHTQ